jgi:hypothetical protein
MYLVVFYVGEHVWVCGCVGVWVGGCVYKIEKFRTLSAPSEIASLREAISSSAAFEQKEPNAYDLKYYNVLQIFGISNTTL